MTSKALAELLSFFDQEEISIWLIHDGMISRHVEWRGHDHNQALVTSFYAGKKTYQQLADYKIFRFDHFVLVLKGKEALELESAYNELGKRNVWILLLIDYEQKKRREQSFNLLSTVSQTIATSIQNESLLDMIIQLTIETIPAADTGFLFLFDEQIKKLLIKSAVGFKEEGYKKTRLVPGEAISGKVFQDKRPIIANGKEKIHELMSNMTKDNFKYYVDSTIYSKFPNSVVSSPLIYEGESIGVLTIDSFIDGGYFTENDLEVLTTLANHVAVAIVQANLFKQEQQHRKELQLTHHALSQEHKQLQRTIDFHNRLTNLVAQGKGVSAILKMIHEVVRTPVAVYDALLKQVLAEDAEEKELPANFIQHPVIKRALQLKKWQIADLGEDHLLMIIPITGAENTLGFLCAWVDQDSEVQLNSILLEYGATVVALEWTKQKAIKEAQERLRGEFLEEVLSGNMTTELSKQARNLGLEINDFYTVLLCQKENSEKGAFFSGIERERLEQSFERILTKQAFGGIVVQRGKYILAVLSFPEDGTRSNYRRTIKDLVPILEKTPEKVQIGIGRIYKGLLHLNEAFQDADQCLTLLRNKMKKKVISYTEIGVYRFFLQHDREELEFLLMDVLGPLIQYEQKKKGHLMETLLQYVQSDQDLNSLTKKLNIHFNTLYYRINRIQEIIGLSFDNSDEWFNVQLACQLYEFLGHGKESGGELKGS
jgi:sugar diacid utilization regulator